MIKVNTITQAIQTAFNEDPEFSDYIIERSEYVNENPRQCPWLGIYRGSIEYLPDTLGGGIDAWEGILTITFIVQQANYESGEKAEDALEDSVEAVISKIFSDTTISDTVDMVKAINVTYSYVAEDEETLYFQAAIIEMTLEVSTS